MNIFNLSHVENNTISFQKELEMSTTGETYGVGYELIVFHVDDTIQRYNKHVCRNINMAVSRPTWL